MLQRSPPSSPAKSGGSNTAIAAPCSCYEVQQQHPLRRVEVVEEIGDAGGVSAVQRIKAAMSEGAPAAE